MFAEVLKKRKKTDNDGCGTHSRITRQNLQLTTSSDSKVGSSELKRTEARLVYLLNPTWMDSRGRQGGTKLCYKRIELASQRGGLRACSICLPVACRGSSRCEENHRLYLTFNKEKSRSDQRNIHNEIIHFQQTPAILATLRITMS